MVPRGYIVCYLSCFLFSHKLPRVCQSTPTHVEGAFPTVREIPLEEALNKLIDYITRYAGIGRDQVEVFPIRDYPRGIVYQSNRRAYPLAQEIVALHGTRASAAVDIAKTGLDPAKVPRYD